jgi:hypothetical protein
VISDSPAQGRTDSALSSLPRAAGCVLVLLLAGCAGGQPGPTPPEASGAVTVTVSMYSGREDPRFVLPDGPSDALRACIRDASGPATTERPPDGLGFRYFDVRGLQEGVLLVGTGGAWRTQGGSATPVAICPDAYALLRRAAASSLPADDASAIPER